MRYKKAIALIVVAALILVGVLAYQNLAIPQEPTPTPESPQTIMLNGAGATFPAPLIQKWSAVFENITGIRVNYEGIGSGGGVKQFTNKTIDFGATDPPMTDAEFAAAPGALHIPITIGGVAAIYNIPGIGKGLRLSGEVLAEIFALNITKWNDPRIKMLNLGVNLPDAEIIVCRRSDSSGTTRIFTAFLSDESPMWRTRYGSANVINWHPSTLGGKGNPGVAALVQQNSYSIGYVELAYAIESGITYADIQNPAGDFVEPRIDTLSAAALAMSMALPPGNASWAQLGVYFNLRKLSNPPKNAYPITSFSYIIVYRELNVRPGMTLEKAKALTRFLWWAVHEGQLYASGLSYVPLPPEVIRHNESTLEMVTFNGQPVAGWK